MGDKSITRREFVRQAAVGTAGLAVGLGSAGGVSAASSAKGQKKIVNYNPEMEYRRLGKTELMLSAVCLGGHWARVNVMNQDFDENRREVVTRCIEVGMNYVDACTAREVAAYTKALSGWRDKFLMGVSNFDEEARDPRRRTAKKLLGSLDEVLALSKQEYADLWRITCLERGSNHTFATSCEIVSALVKAKKQGKARFIGISSHDKRWLKFMIDYFPQIEVILTPYTALTKALPKDSLFDSAVKNDVGILGIKPFAANSLFKGNSTPNNPHAEEDDKLARLTIRYILGNPAVTAPIPGLISAHQVDNVAKAVKERRNLDLAEARELEQAMHRAWANLPQHYQWLKDWEYV